MMTELDTYWLIYIRPFLKYGYGRWRHILSWEVYARILFKRAARGSQICSNMADILTEVMYLYSTGEFVVISDVL